MELKKDAQENLFKKLAQMEIKAHQVPEYNGYTIDGYGYFEYDFNTIYDQFIKELNDNLTARHPSLLIYLQDILKTIEKIANEVYAYHKEEIYDTHTHSPELFKQNKLGYINNFLNFQKSIIQKTISEIEQKISLVKDPELFSPAIKPKEIKEPVSGEEQLPKFTMRLKSALNRKELTVLWWMLSECDFIEFDNDKHIADFLEQNFSFREEDEKRQKIEYKEMTSIASLLSKLKDNVDTRPGPSQLKISDELRKVFEQYESIVLEVLEKTPLPVKDIKTKK